MSEVDEGAGLRPELTLDEAWRVAVAALPGGWVIECGNWPPPDTRGWAQAIGPEVDGRHPMIYEKAKSLPVALRVLAARLRSRAEGSDPQVGHQTIEAQP